MVGQIFDHFMVQVGSLRECLLRRMPPVLPSGHEPAGSRQPAHICPRYGVPGGYISPRPCTRRNLHYQTGLPDADTNVGKSCPEDFRSLIDFGSLVFILSVFRAVSFHPQLERDRREYPPPPAFAGLCQSAHRTVRHAVDR